jgi:Na+/proline symporter
LDSATEESFQFLPDSGFDSWINYFGAWIIIGLGSIPSQDIYQRVMSAKSEKVAVQSTYLAGGFYLTFGLLPLFIALGAKALYPELYLENRQLMLPSMVLAHSGLPVQIIFFGALISAIMSTASSGMLAPAALISENLIKPLFKDKLTDKQLLIILRVSVLGVAILAVWMALQDSNIYELVAGASILMLVSLFIPLTTGLYWSKSSKIGAMLSMIIGMLTYLVVDNFEPEIASHVYGLLASGLAMLIGSLLFPNKPQLSHELS